MKLNILDELNSLCADELSEAYSILYKILDDKILSKDSNHKIIQRQRDQIYCFCCSSIHCNKNGKTKSGRQKYICKDCNKSFSDTTKTVVSYSKKPYDLWRKFIDCELKEMTLRDTACELGISTTCAFNWRHKFHKALEKYVESIKLSGIMQLDATYTNINLKGTKSHNMPRYSKKRPSSAFRGLSHHKVCIMTGTDQNDNIFIKIVGLGKESIAHYNDIKDKIIDPKLLITDQSWGFTTFSKELVCDLDQIPTTAYKSDRGNTLATLNGLHNELWNHMSKYHGVSIRHLQGYLNMFVFMKVLKYKYEYNYRIRQAYINSIPSQATLINKEISKIAFPIDLRKAYGEYRYGIFAN